jgi:hypothetical protein
MFATQNLELFKHFASVFSQLSFVTKNKVDQQNYCFDCHFRFHSFNSTDNIIENFVPNQISSFYSLFCTSLYLETHIDQSYFDLQKTLVQTILEFEFKRKMILRERNIFF